MLFFFVVAAPLCWLSSSLLFLLLWLMALKTCHLEEWFHGCAPAGWGAPHLLHPPPSHPQQFLNSLSFVSSVFSTLVIFLFLLLLIFGLLFFFLFLWRTTFLADACHVCLTPLSELLAKKKKKKKRRRMTLLKFSYCCCCYGIFWLLLKRHAEKGRGEICTFL